MTQHIFTDFEPRHAALWGRHSVNLGHGFAGHDLFSDESLARLIETAPKNTYHVNTMDVAAHDPRTRREGIIEGLTGTEALDAVRRGRIWILLQNPDRLDTRYAHALRAIYDEAEDLVPGFKSYRHKMSILISSPRVQVYYHADVPGQTLWQVRGRKRVYVYPNREPFLPQANLERIVMGAAHEISLPYEPWFDEHATVVDLEPGRMLHWPLNSPHRIVNADCLNVSFTTEHFTPAIRRSFVVNYANGVLRRQLGVKQLSASTAGPGYWGKLAVAGAWKISGRQKKRRQKFKVDFVVDPAAPDCVRTIPAYEFTK